MASSCSAVTLEASYNIEKGRLDEEGREGKKDVANVAATLQA